MQRVLLLPFTQEKHGHKNFSHQRSNSFFCAMMSIVLHFGPFCCCSRECLAEGDLSHQKQFLAFIQSCPDSYKCGKMCHICPETPSSSLSRPIAMQVILTIVKPKQTGSCGRGIRNEHMSNTNTILIQNAMEQIQVIYFHYYTVYHKENSTYMEIWHRG